MSDTSSSDLEVHNPSERPTLSWFSNYSDCSYVIDYGRDCPLYMAVLSYGNLRRLKIDPLAEGEPSWLHNNDPILLRSAVQDDNLDAVCAMLYYGVNLGYASDLTHLPLENGFCDENIEIVKVLINFYDDRFLRKIEVFSYRNIVNLLSLYVQHDATLFKLLFRRMDLDDLDQLNLLFTSLIEIECNELDTADWLECAYLILKSISKPSPHLYNKPFLNIFTYFYCNLLYRFSDKNVQRVDRLRIIHIWLSWGVYPTIDDCEVCYDLYGFGDELEALIYSVNCIKYGSSDEIMLLVLPAVANLNQNLFTNVLRDKLLFFQRPRWNRLLDFLGFYFMSLERKEEVKRECSLMDRSHCPEIIEVLQRINDVPEFPTLFELSRNEVREIIHKSVKYPYQFHDTVKQLDLPACIKDKIRLKIPIY